jgi:steroid delta-isomerase-like uncharacterized protein
MRLQTTLLAAALAACGADSRPPAKGPTMAIVESNQQLVHKLYDLLNTGALDRLGEVIAPDFVAADGSRGPALFAKVMTGLRAGFPDIHYTVDEVVADATRAAVRWTWRGTNSAPFRDFPASGKRIANSGMAIFEIAGGKITAGTTETDRLGFLIGIGVIPYNPAYGPPPKTE